MFNLVQPMFTPFGSAGGVYGQEIAFLVQNGQFRRFWGPPVALFVGPRGPNRPPRMCLTMFNLVQPMFNPFGAVGGAYGQNWLLFAKDDSFSAPLGPPVPLFGGPKGSN